MARTSSGTPLDAVRVVKPPVSRSDWLVANALTVGEPDAVVGDVELGHLGDDDLVLVDPGG
jgi:hypothetical protein